jgi:hypothetical protein
VISSSLNPSFNPLKLHWPRLKSVERNVQVHFSNPDLSKRKRKKRSAHFCCCVKILQDARANLLTRLGQVTAEAEALKNELAEYGAADPVKLAEKRQATVVAKEACRRWTGDFFFPFLSVFYRSREAWRTALMGDEQRQIIRCCYMVCWLRITTSLRWLDCAKRLV